MTKSTSTEDYPVAYSATPYTLKALKSNARSIQLSDCLAQQMMCVENLCEMI